MIFDDIKTLGFGDRLTKLLAEIVGGNRIVDLMYHKPIGVIDRRNTEIIHDKIATLTVEITGIFLRAKPIRIECSGIDLVFFNRIPQYLKKTLKIGDRIAISGKIAVFGSRIQMVHPDYILPASQVDRLMVIEKIYPLPQGITQKRFNEKLARILQSLPNFEEWIDHDIIAKENFPSWREEVIKLHQFNSSTRRLAFDEILVRQLLFRLMKKRISNSNGSKLNSNSLWDKVNLGFELTNNQKSIISEIKTELESGNRMFRLLQGDVGSGKTVIALFSIIKAVEAGYQAVIMVPLSILALQHYNWIKKVTANTGIRVELINSKITGKKREKLLHEVKYGEVNILVGTHAIFASGIEFVKLAMVVIDEQHRFGVDQRVALANHPHNPHTLFMSATPIPRSLLMSYYSHMEVSVLFEKPRDKATIETKMISKSRIDEVLQRIKHQLENTNEKIYWICSLIENDEEKWSDHSVLDRYNEITKLIPDNRIGIIHGKMKQEIKDNIMQKFQDSTTGLDLLIATTVIEVGIDIKDATIIVIENAEKFGLAQLHQLRGRVGRGNKKSYCILLYGEKISTNSMERLKKIRDCEDGFQIAEFDLKTRGGGDIFGKNQAGFLEGRFGNMEENYDLVELANEQIKSESIINLNKKYTTLLNIFGYKNSIKDIFGG